MAVTRIGRLRLQRSCTMCVPTLVYTLSSSVVTWPSQRRFSASVYLTVFSLLSAMRDARLLILACLLSPFPESPQADSLSFVGSYSPLSDI